MNPEFLCLEDAAAQIGIGYHGLWKRVHVRQIERFSWSDIPPECRVYGPTNRLRLWYVRTADLEPLRESLFLNRLQAVPTHHSLADLVYLACAIDCEGNISLHKHRPRHREHWAWSYVALVCVTNTDRRMIDWLSETFGGYVKHRSMREVNPRWKDRYDWCVSACGAYHVLRLASPYLKLKGEQADLLIEFYDRNAQKQSRQRLVPGEAERREALALRIHELNSNGPPAP